MVKFSVEPPGPVTRISSVLTFVAAPQGDPPNRISPELVTRSVAESPASSVAVTSISPASYAHDGAAAATSERAAPTEAATISAAESLNAMLILAAVFTDRR